MHIIVFGDSIAQGFWDKKGGWVQRLREVFDEKMLLALSASDPKNMTKYIALFNALNKGTNLSPAERTQVATAKAGLNTLNTLEQSYSNAVKAGLTATGSGLGRLGGVRGSVSRITQTSPEASIFSDTKEAFLSLISRASGERGVLTDYDVKRIKKALPDFYDSPQVAQGKLRTVRQIVTNALNSYQGGSSQVSSDNSSLYELLGTQ